MICDIPMQASSGSVDPKLFHMQPPAGLYKGPRRVQEYTCTCTTICCKSFCYFNVIFVKSDIHVYDNFCEVYNYYGHVSLSKYFKF